MTITRVKQGQLEIVLKYADVTQAVKEYIIKNFDSQSACALSMTLFPERLGSVPCVLVQLHWHGDTNVGLSQ